MTQAVVHQAHTGLNHEAPQRQVLLLLDLRHLYQIGISKLYDHLIPKKKTVSLVRPFSSLCFAVVIPDLYSLHRARKRRRVTSTNPNATFIAP